MPEIGPNPRYSSPYNSETDRTGQVLVGGARDKIQWDTAGNVVTAGGGVKGSSVLINHIQSLGRIQAADTPGVFGLGYGYAVKSGVASTEPLSIFPINGTGLAPGQVVQVGAILVATAAVAVGVTKEIGFFKFTPSGLTYTLTEAGKIVEVFTADALAGNTPFGHSSPANKNSAFNTGNPIDFYACGVKLGALPAGSSIDIFCALQVESIA